MLEQLQAMIRAYETEHDIPENAIGHRALLNNPAWKKVQQFAKEIRDSIYPTLP